MTWLEKFEKIMWKSWHEIILFGTDRGAMKEWNAYIALMKSLNPTQKLLPIQCNSITQGLANMKSRLPIEGRIFIGTMSDYEGGSYEDLWENPEKYGFIPEGSYINKRLGYFIPHYKQEENE